MQINDVSTLRRLVSTWINTQLKPYADARYDFRDPLIQRAMTNELEVHLRRFLFEHGVRRVGIVLEYSSDQEGDLSDIIGVMALVPGVGKVLASKSEWEVSRA